MHHDFSAAAGDRSAADLLAGGGEMGGLMRARDWSATALGPPGRWPQSLRVALNILLDSGYPMYIAWGEQCIQFYNDAFRPILGSTKHPGALGASTFDTFAETWDFIGPMFRRVLTLGEASTYADQLIDLDRHGYLEECYFTFSYSAIRDEHGAIGGVFVTVLETTERMLGERRLRTLRDLGDKRSFIGAEHPCAVAARILGDNLHDVPFALFYELDDAARAARLVGASGIAPGGPAAPPTIDLHDAHAAWPLAGALLGSGGETLVPVGAGLELAVGQPWPQLPQQAVMLPIVPPGHAAASAVLVAGVSPRRALDEPYADFYRALAQHVATALAEVEAYQHERRRAEALAEIDRAKTAFFSNVSHEFRTPLTLMLGPLEELLAGPGADRDPQQTALVEVAHRNGLRLLKLVNSLLDFARIEAGRAEASYAPLDLASCTADLAASFSSAIRRAGLALVVDCPPLPEPVFVDREMWEKVVLNLISNAFKFTFAGEIGVTLRPSADGAAAVLVVRDTGTGIPEGELPRVFERFHQVEGTRGRTFEGSGIGLALVQELVRLHGGTIAVESALGRGSSFTVSVPFGSAHLPAERLGAVHARPSTGVRAQAYVEEALRWLPDGDDAASAARETPSPSAPDDLAARGTAAPAAGQRVLVADDNADMRGYLRRLLIAAGYQVEAVADGEAALAAAQRHPPDLLLTDMMMPGLDGLGLLESLRADPVLRDVPVLLLSARAGEEARVQGLGAGADDYLTKPFSARELVARVAGDLQLARARRDSERALREEARTLETLNRLGSTVAAELDLERAVQVVTDAATELSGASFGAFFYNVVDQAGERYTLYTLAGAPREAFAQFPMPRNTAVFGPTFAGAGIVRAADITQDPRYGQSAPYHGMPEGHLPVRSYLAAPVVSRSGEVLGGLFFGHPEAGVFTERAERLVAGIAVHAASAIDNAHLYRAAQVELAERRQTEAALRESEARFRNMADHAPVMVWLTEPSGACTYLSRSWCDFSGQSEDAALGFGWLEAVHPDDRERTSTTFLAANAEHEPFRLEYRLRRADGEYRWAIDVATPRFGEDGAFRGHVGSIIDITERKAVEDERERLVEALSELTDSLEARVDERTAALAAANRELLAQIEERERIEQALRQAQKMEIIGQLTGGVAHDFNNLLTIIIGNLETLQRQLERASPDPARLQRSAANAIRGAERAASLTQRLLAFSRRQPLEPRAVDVNRLVGTMSDMLRRTLGEQITVETVLSGGLWRTHVDLNQLESALLNLAINARDAMPDGGRLTIETANTQLDEHYAARQAEVAPGHYVVIAITDNGTGMSREVSAQAFEPFYTTKDIGQGTGLGLSQVYGFVKQSGGHVKIYSELGQGTTIKIYLPRLRGEHEAAAAPEWAERAADDDPTQTVLVVEDDDDVRAHSTEILEELGYRVLEAPNAQAALEILDRRPEIALLFTDIGLPGGMNGRELASEACRRRPNLAVLYTTGYSRNAIVHDGRLDPGVQLLTKPFTYAALAAKMRDLLDRQAAPPCILLVEDEALVRMVTVEALRDLGFRVEEAASATEALGKVGMLAGRIDAAILDVGLPDRRGDALAGELRAMFARLPIVIATGYGDRCPDGLGDDELIGFLGKPYDSAELTTVLRGLGVRMQD